MINVLNRTKTTKGIEMTQIRWKTRLRELRAKNNITRMDLVRELNLSYPTVSTWEKGLLSRLDGRIIDAFMQYFKVTYEELIYPVQIDENGNEIKEDGAA